MTISSFFFQAEDGIRDVAVTGVQTCALPIACQQKVDHYGRRDDQHIQRSPPRVEEQRCKDQPAQCPRSRTSAKHEESGKSHWNKTEDEFVGIEQHAVCSAKELG